MKLDSNPAATQEGAGRSRRTAAEFPFDGLGVLLAIVVVGLAVTAGLFHWMAPRAKAAFDASLAAEPTSPEGRLARWMDFGVPMIHSRLKQLRLSGAQPWLVTHVVRPDPELDPQGAPEVFGCDLTDLEPDVIRREGMRVLVSLPEPRSLGRAHLRGDNARLVPELRHDQTPADPHERALSHANWILEKLREALEGDIPGATIVVEFEAR